jgi:ferredoxin/flavodoxin
MQNITIFYFSGTGNTAWAVNTLSEKLKDLGFDVTLLSCEKDVDPAAAIQNCDIAGFAFPIHASFAPRNVQDFLEQVPVVSEKPIIGLTTAGYAAGDVLIYSLRPLRKKGYTPAVFCNIIVGNNMHLPGLSPLPVTVPDKLEKNLVKAEKKIDKMAGLIKEGETHIEGGNPFARLLGIIQRATSESFEKRAFKGFYADESCIECGWCVRNCPVENIEMTGGSVVFHDRCIICMRCYSYCPEHAVQLSEKTKNETKYKRYKGPSG